MPRLEKIALNFAILIAMQINRCCTDKSDYFPDLTRRSHFPRNLTPDFTHYLSERPKMTSNGGKPRKAKTMKGNKL